MNETIESYFSIDELTVLEEREMQIHNNVRELPVLLEFDMIKERELHDE